MSMWIRHCCKKIHHHTHLAATLDIQFARGRLSDHALRHTLFPLALFLELGRHPLHFLEKKVPVRFRPRRFSARSRDLDRPPLPDLSRTLQQTHTPGINAHVVQPESERLQPGQIRSVLRFSKLMRKFGIHTWWSRLNHSHNTVHYAKTQRGHFCCRFYCCDQGKLQITQRIARFTSRCIGTGLG